MRKFVAIRATFSFCYAMKQMLQFDLEWTITLLFILLHYYSFFNCFKILFFEFNFFNCKDFKRV